MPIVSMSIFSLSFRSLSWRIECPWRNVSFNFGSWPGWGRRSRSRNAAEGRCMCVFVWRLGRWVSSDYNDSVFCKEETSTAIGMIKEKKKTDVQNWKKVKRKKSPRKSNPPQYLWGCFEGVFVPDLTRLGMREGVFVPDLTRSGVQVRGLGVAWTSGPTRSDRDQHQTRSRTRHRNLTRLVSYFILTSYCWSIARNFVGNKLSNFGRKCPKKCLPRFKNGALKLRLHHFVNEGPGILTIAYLLRITLYTLLFQLYHHTPIHICNGSSPNDCIRFWPFCKSNEIKMKNLYKFSDDFTRFSNLKDHN